MARSSTQRRVRRQVFVTFVLEQTVRGTCPEKIYLEANVRLRNATLHVTIMAIFSVQPQLLPIEEITRL